jgi:hypothetical protein
MKTLNYFLILILTFSAKDINAQVVPGYLGKKNSFNYQLNVSPAVIGPNQVDKTSWFSYDTYPKTKKSSFITPFNFTHSFNFQRVISRKIAINFGYGFFTTRQYVNLFVNDVIYTQNNYLLENIGYNIINKNFNLSATFYRGRAIAPFGVYWRLGLSYGINKTIFDNDNPKLIDHTEVNYYYYSIPPELKFNISDQNLNFKSILFNITYGKSRIFKKCIIFNRGLNFTLTRSLIAASNSDMVNQTKKRVRGHELFSFYVSVGYLF